MLQLSNIPGITWKIEINAAGERVCGGGGGVRGKWKMTENVWVSGSTVCVCVWGFPRIGCRPRKKQLQRGKERSTKVASEEEARLRGGRGAWGVHGLFTLISKATRETFLHRKFQFSASWKQEEQIKANMQHKAKSTHAPSRGGRRWGGEDKRRAKDRQMDSRS